MWENGKSTLKAVQPIDDDDDDDDDVLGFDSL
jgi:hypothetical protein